VENHFDPCESAMSAKLKAEVRSAAPVAWLYENHSPEGVSFDTPNPAVEIHNDSSTSKSSLKLKKCW
jgi:hypothetical protein